MDETQVRILLDQLAQSAEPPGAVSIDRAVRTGRRRLNWLRAASVSASMAAVLIAAAIAVPLAGSRWQLAWPPWAQPVRHFPFQIGGLPVGWTNTSTVGGDRGGAGFWRVVVGPVTAPNALVVSARPSAPCPAAGTETDYLRNGGRTYRTVLYSPGRSELLCASNVHGLQILISYRPAPHLIGPLPDLAGPMARSRYRNVLDVFVNLRFPPGRTDRPVR